MTSSLLGGGGANAPVDGDDDEAGIGVSVATDGEDDEIDS